MRATSAGQAALRTPAVRTQRYCCTMFESTTVPSRSKTARRRMLWGSSFGGCFASRSAAFAAARSRENAFVSAVIAGKCTSSM